MACTTGMRSTPGRRRPDRDSGAPRSATRRLDRALELSEAIRFGVATGLLVMNPGTQLCRVEDVERLYAEVGVAPTTR